MNNNLYRPNFGNLIQDQGYSAFCGPAVLAIVTNRNVREVVRDITRLRNEKGMRERPRRAAVTGMYTWELLGHIESCGHVCIDVTPDFEKGTRFNRYYGMTETVFKRPTVNQWLKATAESRGDDVYLFVAGNHFFLISGNEMVDCQFGGRVRSIQKMRYKRARIDSVHCILKNV